METMIRILHLEDDPMDAELVQARFEEADLACRITWVQTQDEFETALGNGGTDIILADYRLPGYDGMSALRVTLGRCPEIPFIFVSGTMGEEAAIEALTKGATDYVLKQNLSRLPSAVNRALIDARNRREHQRQSMINMARLRLMQFAATHCLDELLEEAINEAEKETDSLIGFYASVDDDQKSLTLQNWSTRTKAQFCKARGKGLHYPIADAGVWVDCVHRRQPVVHNDYLSLPHRKDLPEGHAEVVRELVVPVMRDEKVKAILGVGNKPADYSQKDAEAMSLLADIVWEIAERKQAEQKVALMSFALNSIHEAAFMIDEKACFQYVNDEACRILGYARDELLAMSMTDIYPGLPMERWPGRWNDLKEHGALIFEGEIKGRDGHLLPVEINANYFEYEGLSFGLGLARDITERRQAEIRMNEQLYFLQQLLDSIPIPVYYKDREGLYLGCNAAFEAFNGWSRQEIVGKTVHEVVPKERADNHHTADLALLRHPGVQTYEISGIYPDGKRHDVIFNKATFVDANGRVAGTVGALLDITDRKRAERERLANLNFFESMDRINRALQSAEDLEEMMKDLLDVSQSIFDCDRAFLIHPCDPGSPTWNVPMERHKPEYTGLSGWKVEMPMDPQIAKKHRILLAADGPVAFGPGAPHALPEDVSKQFGIKCMMAMAIYPKTGSPWEFGIHQCTHARVWTAEEMKVFEAIGRRLADSLSSLLTLRDLRKSEEFLNNIVENIPNMIFVKDAQTLRFVRFNRAGEQLLGYVREELLGKNDYDFFPKEEADFFTAKDRQVLDSRVPADIPEETISTRSDEERILHTQKIPILNENGAPQYLLGISEDITERKQAEASIRKLSQAIEQSPVSIVITDVAGKIEFVNAKFTQVTGYTDAEALGRNPRILKSGETSAEAYRQLWKTISEGGVWQGEFHNRKKNGELFWEQGTIAPVRDADNVISHYVAVKEDISERKKLEAQLRQAQRMEAIGQLAGGVAHDFNNMLGVIIGYAEIALGKKNLDESLRNYLEQILEATRRSTQITRQLLAFARKQTIDPKILDLNMTVEGMLKLLRRLIGESIDLAWLPGSTLWPVKMDPSQVDQILANLCVNAKDAIDGVGKITIETHNTDFDDAYCTEHKGFSPGAYVMLAVSDTGSGMDKPTVDKIFEPFFTTKGVGRGTGLGLATVYGIVKQNEGFINVYSEPGHGSTFKIYLPRHEGLSSQEPMASLEPQVMGGHETILVVEDETLNLQMVKLMLEKYGYRVLAALAPGEALRMAKAHTGGIHLLLTDLIMPEMDGRDLAKAMTALDPGILCLFMSGYTGDVIVHQGILDEGIHFIQKPFSKQDLAKKIREVLDGK